MKQCPYVYNLPVRRVSGKKFEKPDTEGVGVYILQVLEMVLQSTVEQLAAVGVHEQSLSKSLSLLATTSAGLLWVRRPPSTTHG